MIPPPELHEHVCRALQNAGGVRCEVVIPQAEAVKADCYFREWRTLVEVKSLTTDRNKTDSVRKRSGQILQESSRIGGPIIFGDVNIGMGDLPSTTAEKLLRNLGQRVMKEVKAANSQIKKTAEALGIEPRGLLIFALPAHFDTHPGLVATAAARVLRPGKHQAIHAMLIVTVPSIGGGARPPTITFCPRIHSEIPHSLMDQIVHCWLQHFASVTGSLVTVSPGTADKWESIFLVDDDDWSKA